MATQLNIFIKTLLIPALLVIFTIQLHAQEFSTTSAKAIKLYRQGQHNYNLAYLEDAEKDLKKAIAVDEEFLEAYMLLGDVYKSSGKKVEAIEIYQKVVDIDDKKYPEVYFFSGLLFFENQDYSTAIKHFDKYLDGDGLQAGRISDASFYKACAVFAIDAIANPVPFSPVNVGKNINTSNDEYINAVKADGLTFYFTGRNSMGNGIPGGDDFYYSHRTTDTSTWQMAQKLGKPINTPGDEGALTISPDGRYLLFAGCQWDDGFGSCDIYVSKFSGSKAGTPVNLGGVINSGAWESQPSLASDGRTLYFASARGGGKGKSDLWKSYLEDDGLWSKPENLGGTINTSGSEMAPFIHPDGQTLYFSSDRLVGMGGIDLFVSRLDSSGSWSKPQNLGFPLNTSGDEINIVVDAAGIKGFISANQLGGFGGYDIFEFDLYDEIRPIPSTYIKGVIVDALTKKPLEAYFSLIDLKSQVEVVRSFSDENTGAFLVCIPTNREYALNVSKENYLFYSENYSLTGIKTDVKPYLINIELNPISAGESIILRNVFFNSEEYELKDESRVELEKLFDFLESNPNIRIEIRGHTDNMGTEFFNITLSEKRARAVYQYLIMHGIDENRLEYRGYGFSIPLSDNKTEKGRALNRRTEVKILEVGE